MKKLIIFLSILLVVIDQVIKFFISNSMEVYNSIKVIPNFFYITYVKNSGAAFSILTGARWMFIVIALLAIAILIKGINKDKNITKSDMVVYSLILGGIIGNLIDRIIYGYVIDYMDFYIFGYDAPIFNFADMCLVSGAILVICIILKGDKYEDNNSRRRIE